MLTENTINKLWKKIEEEKFLVIRNYEAILDELNHGGDIDILCGSKKRMVELMGAKALSDGGESYNYQVSIDGLCIRMDIREVGDNYYDEKWEKEMIINRKKYKQFYIMCEEDDKYSLLYHALLHKKKIAEKYRNRFYECFHTSDERKLIDILAEFLIEKKYTVEIPLDRGVDFNYDIFEMLSRKLKNT